MRYFVQMAQRITRGLQNKAKRAIKRLSPPASLPYLYIPPLGPPAGRKDFNDQRVVLAIYLGRKAGDIESITKQWTKLAKTNHRLRPLIVIDVDNPWLLCPSGLHVEHIAPADEWRAHSSTPWEDYVDARLAEIKRYYRPAQTVFMSDGPAAGKDVRSANHGNKGVHSIRGY